MLKLKASKKNIIVLAHAETEVNEDSGETISKLVLQGSIGKAPIGDYTTVLEATSMTINKKLKGMQNDLMKLTEWELEDGIKYLFVTRRTKRNPISLARSASDLWERNELYIDNSIQNVIERLEEYYDE